MILGFHHYYFICPPDGRDAARAFYGGLLEMRASPPAAALDDGELLWFFAGDVALHLRFSPDPEPASPRRHLAMRVADAATLRRRLEDAGHATDDAVDLPGQRRFYARDPFGNRIEFVEIVGPAEACSPEAGRAGS
jgi:catechol 2,3-dioxygenase-like lactoylglutathione lyase family enzyme